MEKEKKKVLIVIDVQNDFVTGTWYAGSSGYYSECKREI